MSWHECEICGEPGERVTLTGGLLADLCKAHRNAWHEYIIQTGFLLKRHGLEAEIAAAVRGGRPVLANGSASLLHGCDTEIFKLAKAWVAAQKDAHIASEPKGGAT